MSAVIYARVPETLKQALHQRAADRGLTLTQALVELLERGFEAIADEQSVRELEGKFAASTRELEQTRGRLREAELSLRAAREREQLTARTYSAVAERSRQALASCPRCRKPVRGCDLLVRGRCPHCNKPLTSLLLPAPRANLDSNEYHALLGALGVLVGLALAATPESAG